MAWRALTPADVQTALSGQELTAVQTFALQSGQVDPTPQVILAVMDEVRGYIAGSREVTLGAEGTIPDKLVDTAIDMCVWKLVTRFPTKLLATPAREKRYGDAIGRLKDVANGKFRIEFPLTPTTELLGGVLMPTISAGYYRSGFTPFGGVRNRVRCEQDGI